MSNPDPNPKNSKNICFQIREDLKKCLLNSNCVVRDKKTLKECLSVSDGSVPTECQLIRNRYFHCKNISYRGRLY
ncbi:hypothetical protein RN001_006783 [Aquatica leii]|uniref:Cytochrome c oxidase assembly factor 5 n=1 Tax=Aquatica leii TaxID=1421715 RepID=A0AAN7PE35_9COLE|nr:hypothetical protein RN001_006783 [Aquatica leii]